MNLCSSEIYDSTYYLPVTGMLEYGDAAVFSSSYECNVMKKLPSF